MKRLFSLIGLVSVASLSLGDGWLLKAPYEPKASWTWNVSITTNIKGQDRTAQLKQNLTIESKTENEIRGKGSWTNIVVAGGGQNPPDAAWEMTFRPDGSLASAGQSASYGRMLAPAAFVYPNKEVKTFDSWTVKYRPFKGAKEVTVEYMVLDITRVGDEEVMKVRGKLTENGPMKGNLLFWIAKDGRVLKYDFDLTSWVIPFAAESPDLDAKVKGELVKDSD